MHSKFEQQDKQSDNSSLLSVQGDTLQSCPLQQSSKGHRTQLFPIDSFCSFKQVGECEFKIITNIKICTVTELKHVKHENVFS